MTDRKKTAKFFTDAFGYKIQTEFNIDFADKTCAKCIALDPPEKPVVDKLHWLIKQYVGPICLLNEHIEEDKFAEFHLPPEIFVSDGDPDSIVGKWVSRRDGIGGIHHMAYQVENIEKTMKEWKAKGYAEFSSEKPFAFQGLNQVFTKPSELTGVIYELIEKTDHGFCKY